MFDHLLAPLRDTLRPSFQLMQDPIGGYGCNHVRSGELPDCEPHTSGHWAGCVNLILNADKGIQG